MPTAAASILAIYQYEIGRQRNRRRPGRHLCPRSCDVAARSRPAPGRTGAHGPAVVPMLSGEPPRSSSSAANGVPCWRACSRRSARLGAPVARTSWAVADRRQAIHVIPKPLERLLLLPKPLFQGADEVALSLRRSLQAFVVSYERIEQGPVDNVAASVAPAWHSDRRAPSKS